MRMSNHICFEAIDCKELVYMKPANCWVCLRCFCELKYVDNCMRCRFNEKRKKEKAIREGSYYGELL